MSRHNRDRRLQRQKVHQKSRAMKRLRDLPVEQQRQLISDITHKVVLQVLHHRFPDHDGMGYCMFYALVGALTATQVTGRHWSPQAGSMRLWPDPSTDYAFTFDSTQRGVESGEFHAWMACKWPDGRLEVADLSARHYGSMIEKLPTLKERVMIGPACLYTLDDSPKPSWKRPHTDYVWFETPPDGRWPEHLDWLRFNTDQAACLEMSRRFQGDQATVQRMISGVSDELTDWLVRD